MRKLHELLAALGTDRADNVVIERQPRVGVSTDPRVASRRAHEEPTHPFCAFCGSIEMLITQDERDVLVRGGASDKSDARP